MTQFIPLMHRALVKPKQVETTTASGIVIPDTTTRKEQAATTDGIIIALGDTFGKDFGAGVIPKIGDKIMYAKYSGMFVKDDDDTDLVFLNDDDIICIVREDT